VALRRIANLRALRLTLSACTIAVAVTGAVSAVQGWRSSASDRSTRQIYSSLRSTAAREETDLRAAYETPRSQTARARFFVVARQAATLLARLPSAAPSADAARVQRIEARHDAALAAAASALGAQAERSDKLERALALLEDVQAQSASGQMNPGPARSSAWPATHLEQVEAGAIALVLLVGLLTLIRSLRRAAGLEPRDARARSEIESLTRAARSDSLTGLANRRAFEDDLARLIQERNSSGTPFSLLAFDLDGLKRVNDVHGHQAGDSYIRAAAESLCDEIGARGSVYRTGGDEFLALLPGARGWHALTLAHNIQRHARKATGRRALSIGITESTRTESRRSLLHQADLALYEAKRAKLLAVSYHAGLEPRSTADGTTAPSEQEKALAAALARAVDAKDAGTRHHSETVAELCVAIGARLGAAGDRLERLRLAGLLHDVGKIGVSDTILRKLDPLTESERAELELHATIGHSILTSAELHDEAVWVLHHHERFDGTGYPTGLAEQAIPWESRILAVADAFEAMTGSRPYRETMTPDEALAELVRCGGTQFDPDCVQALDGAFGGSPTTFVAQVFADNADAPPVTEIPSAAASA
jgi:diguanylate cyclase (GGDEF)-like protein